MDSADEVAELRARFEVFAAQRAARGGSTFAEIGDQYLVSLSLPGADRDSLRISVEKGVLSVAGTRREIVRRGGCCSAAAAPDPQITRPFELAYELPGEVDAENLSSASRGDQVLITIPKSS